MTMPSRHAMMRTKAGESELAAATAPPQVQVQVPVAYEKLRPILANVVAQQVTTRDTTAQAPKGYGLDAGAALMNLFFDPVEAPFRLCCVGSAAVCCATESAAVNDMQCECDCCGGACSVFKGRWGISRIWKGCALFVAFFLYVFALVWIVAIHQGVQTCDLGGVQASAMTDALMGLTLSSVSKTAATNFTQAIACDPAKCHFSLAGTDVNFETYINFRLSIYLISAAPILYLLCMLVLHMQQASNDMMKALFPGSVENTPVQVDTANLQAVFWHASDAFEPQNWHLFWLSMLVLLNFFLGIVAAMMDISLAQYLASNWDATSPCYLVEKNMVHYQPGVRISLKDLPIALCVPCMIYTLWSLMFLINSVINLFVRKLETRNARAGSVTPS